MERVTRPSGVAAVADQLVVSEIHVDDDVTLGLSDPLGQLLGELDDAEYRVTSVRAVTNTYPGEAKAAKTYFVRRMRIDHRGEDIHVVSCTCPSFKYNQLPYAKDVRSGDASLHAIGRCKHGDRALRSSRSTDERRQDQGGLDEYAVDDAEQGGE
jgi:hypothetical protein